MTEKPNDPKEHRTYLMIDGEAIRWTFPKVIRLAQTDKVPNGKIEVLRKRKPKK